MEIQKQKSIKVIGLIFMILSSLIVILNLFSALFYHFFGLANVQSTPEVESNSDIFHFILTHLLWVYVFFIVLGLLFFLGGLLLKHYKLMGSRLLSILLSIVLLQLWVFTGLIVNLSYHMPSEMQSIIVSMGILQGIVFTIPLLVFLWFLNKKSTIQQLT